MKRTDSKELAKSLLRGHEPFSNRTKTKTIEDIVFRAKVESANYPPSSHRHRGKPGELIKSLSQEDRDILRDCKSSDWNHRNK